MRALVAGRFEAFEALGDLLSAMESTHGITPGEIGRVENAFDVLELLDGKQPAVVFLEVAGPSDPGLAQVRSLTGRGARVVVLCAAESAEVRVAAIAAGAKEVLFAPWTPGRVQKRLSASMVTTSAVEMGMDVDFRALLLAEGETGQVAARIRRLSGLGFMAETTMALRRDSVVRAAIQVPAPHRLPVLFARVVTDFPGPPRSVSARFVGLTEEEEGILADVLGLGQAPSHPQAGDGATHVSASFSSVPIADTLARVIEELDAKLILEVSGRWLGFPLPQLTESERSALGSGGPLEHVAVWRTRAHVATAFLAATPESLRADVSIPFDDWREALRRAKDLTRGELTARVAAGEADAIREMRDLQARLTAASDRFDRSAQGWGAIVGAEPRGPLEAPASPATFVRPTDPIPLPAPSPSASPRSSSAGRRVRLLGLGIAMCAGIAALIALRLQAQRRRDTDVSTMVVAERTVLVAGGVRVRSKFRDAAGRTVLVVDGSWYQLPGDEARIEATKALAKEAADDAPLIVRDYHGRVLASVEPGGPVTLGAAQPAGRASPSR